MRRRAASEKSLLAVLRRFKVPAEVPVSQRLLRNRETLVADFPTHELHPLAREAR
jgi:hypothetical protein